MQQVSGCHTSFVWLTAIPLVVSNAWLCVRWKYIAVEENCWNWNWKCDISSGSLSVCLFVFNYGKMVVIKMLNAMYVHNSTRKNGFIILLCGMWEENSKMFKRKNSTALIIWKLHSFDHLECGIYTGDTENSKSVGEIVWINTVTYGKGGGKTPGVNSLYMREEKLNYASRKICVGKNSIGT